jgi:hypothetical protein
MFSLAGFVILFPVSLFSLQAAKVKIASTMYVIFLFNWLSSMMSVAFRRVLTANLGITIKIRSKIKAAMKRK